MLTCMVSHALANLPASSRGPMPRSRRTSAGTASASRSSSPTGEVLDGRHREQACREHGIDCPRIELKADEDLLRWSGWPGEPPSRSSR
jgi:hypothetical protein